MAHKRPPLRFAYGALEPYIDAETMEPRGQGRALVDLVFIHGTGDEPRRLVQAEGIRSGMIPSRPGER